MIILGKNEDNVWVTNALLTLFPGMPMLKLLTTLKISSVAWTAVRSITLELIIDQSVMYVFTYIFTKMSFAHARNPLVVEPWYL